MLIKAHRYLAPLLLLCATNLAQAAIYFNLERADHKLTITNLGNDSAFYPLPLRLLADGQWEPLRPLHGGLAPAELQGGGQIDFHWGPLPSGQGTHPIAALQPVMMRFYDQAGAGFGQISFFNQPPPVSAPIEAEYRGGRLHLQAPTEARATWLLWAQEEGITPLREAVQFQHRQPAAKRIAWAAGGAPQRFDLGGGQPSAMLLHETPQGIELQILASGGLQGREQRAAWLDASRELSWAALALLVAALLSLVWHWRQNIRGRKA